MTDSTQSAAVAFDREETLFPDMRVIPALVQQPEIALTTSKPKDSVSIGAAHMPGHGPVLFLGIHTKAGDAVIGALAFHHAETFFGEVDILRARIADGEFQHEARPQ